MNRWEPNRGRDQRPLIPTPGLQTGKDLDRSRRKERSAEKEREAEGIGGLLGRYLSASRLQDSLMVQGNAFKLSWAHAAGDLKDDLVPVRLEADTLIVKAKSPAARFGLRFRSGEIAEFLRREGHAIQQIREG